MNQIYNILDYGAVADGVTNNAVAIQQAIDEACVAGGRVVVPAGRFLSGTIKLKSNIEFRLEAGAVLISSLKQGEILEFTELFEEEDQDTLGEGGCFLFACHAKNITLSGEGILYGQGDQVFYDDNADMGAHECPLNVTAFRPRTTYFEDVTNLTIKDITVQDAAFWTLHMAGCHQVLVKDIRILNNVRGANNDGIDPDCCQDVMIKGCLVKTGDDAIVIKSTKPMAKKYGGCENIVIHNCILYSHDSALKIGTETYGDIRNILFSDCIIKDCSRGVGIWVRDGATIEEIHVHHITGSVRKYADGIRESGPSMWWGNGEAIFLDATYRKDTQNAPGKIRAITFDHIYMKAESSMFFAGEENARIEEVSVTDFSLTMCRQGTQETGYFDEQPSMRHVYPHSIPAVYARYVEGIKIDGKIFVHEDYERLVNQIYEAENCTGEEIHIKRALIKGEDRLE